MVPESTIPDLPTIETPRLILRKLCLEDVPALFAYASDPEVARYTNWWPMPSIEYSRRLVEWSIENYPNGKLVSWGIQHKADGIVIGTCGYDLGWGGEQARGELVFALARPYWNQGLMTETVRAAISFGFTTMNLNRIEATCDPENVGSWRAMEKAGMQREGIVRRLVKGHWSDRAMYSILRKEWQP